MGVDGIRVERLADERIGFEKVDAGYAAELAEVKSGQIAEITETALRGEGKDFEVVFEEVGFGGDFERAAVVLCAADDNQRGVRLAFAARDAEARKFVAESFARAFPPVSKNADTRLEPEADGVDDHAVRAGAGNAEEIFFLFGLLKGSGEAESDFLDRAMSESFRSLGNVPGKIEFLGKDISGAAGKKSERDAMTVLMSGEAVDDFIERAIAAAGDDQAAIFGSGARGDFDGVARAGGFGEVGVDAAVGENVASLVEEAAASMAAVAGVGVVDEERVL